MRLFQQSQTGEEQVQYITQCIIFNLTAQHVFDDGGDLDLETLTRVQWLKKSMETWRGPCKHESVYIKSLNVRFHLNGLTNEESHKPFIIPDLTI